MYKSIIDRIEEKLLHNKNYKALSVTWYGAEPLLGLKQIKDLTPKLLDLALKYNLKYTHDMITNGLLLKEKVFKELVDDFGIEYTTNDTDIAYPCKPGVPPGFCYLDRKALFGNNLSVAFSQTAYLE